jgi:Putative binding domain, N-terminal
MGNGTVAIGIGANPDQTPRSGTLTVAGQTVTVNQDAAPPPCTFSLSDTTFSVTAAAADETIHVNASASSCAWTASSDVPWMAVTSGASGTGNGPVSFHIDANPDPSPRTGTLTIAGQTLTVTQDAGP